MSYLESVLLVLHILVAVAICGFVLLQHGKGADMGAAFGSGSSGSLFGAAGSANFLSRTTAVLAAVFFLTSIGLTWYGTTRGKPGGLMEKAVIEKTLPASKAADVPSSAPAGTPPSAPATLPSPAPSIPAAPASKSSDVPK